MKKNKKTINSKESRKLAKKELENQIIEALKTITAKYANDEKKTNKLISKNAKQLSVKLAKQFRFDLVTASNIPEAIVKDLKKPASKPVKPKVKKEETPSS